MRKTASPRAPSKRASLGGREHTGGTEFNAGKGEGRQEAGPSECPPGGGTSSVCLHSGSHKASSDVREPIRVLKICRRECAASLDYPPCYLAIPATAQKFLGPAENALVMPLLGIGY